MSPVKQMNAGWASATARTSAGAHGRIGGVEVFGIVEAGVSVGHEAKGTATLATISVGVVWAGDFFEQATRAN